MRGTRRVVLTCARWGPSSGGPAVAAGFGGRAMRCAGSAALGCAGVPRIAFPARGTC